MESYDIEVAKSVPKDSLPSRIISSRPAEERVVEEGFELWQTLEDVAKEYVGLSREVYLESDVMLRPQVAWEQNGTEYRMTPAPEADQMQEWRDDGYEPASVTFHYNEETDPLHGTLTYTPDEDAVSLALAFEDSVPEEARDAVVEAVERFGFNH